MSCRVRLRLTKSKKLAKDVVQKKSPYLESLSEGLEMLLSGRAPP